MNRERVRDIAIGLTTLIGLAGLALTLFLFGELRSDQTYPLTLTIDNAAGLYRAAPVTLNGVRVGEVREINPAEDPRDGVVLALAIARGVNLPRHIEVRIERGFVGDANLSLRPGKGPAPEGETFLRPGETIAASTAPATGISDLAATLPEKLDSIVAAADSIKRLGETYTRVGERIETFVAPRTPEQVDAGLVEPNLISAVARLDRAAKDAQVWLSDDQLRANAKRAVAQAADLFERAAAAVESWNDTARIIATKAEHLTENADTITKDFAELSRAMGDTIEDVRSMLGQVNSGQGTIGMLLKNPDLYNALTDASRRLEKALLEAQLLVEKYRKEGVPIRW
ncbi:MAG: MlaD family protein [Phycisphaerales bacterium]